MPVKLAELVRGDIVESVHMGDIVVVNSENEVLFKIGNPDKITYFHSSAKPFQALAALESGAVERYSLDLREIALMASSHSGDKEHIEVLKHIMEKLNIDKSYLKCGIHEPLSKDAVKELAAAGQCPSVLHCNCSGKHLGMIAAAKTLSQPLEEYYKEGHRIQEIIKDIVSIFCGIRPSEIKIAVDGCGVPVYAVPLRNMALAYANLCNDNFMDGKYKRSQNYIVSAMTMYPEMVAGKGRFDTELMKRFGDRIIGKSGAEGVFCGGLLGKSVGIAMKIEDGSSRAIAPVILELLVRRDILDKDEAKQMEKFWHLPILNNKGNKVGELKPSL